MSKNGKTKVDNYKPRLQEYYDIKLLNGQTIKLKADRYKKESKVINFNDRAGKVFLSIPSNQILSIGSLL